jgi:hypothetical protein
MVNFAVQNIFNISFEYDQRKSTGSFEQCAGT